MKKSGPKEILVIDDDPDVQIYLKKILENAGFKFSQALDVQEGISKIQEVVPHLVLLDYRLQEDVGFKIIQFMKKVPAFRNIPIIMMSATINKKLIIKSIEAGATEFIAKPLQAPMLIQRLKKILKDFALPIIHLGENNLAQATSVGDIIKINELGFFLQSSIKLAKGAKLQVKSDFLKTMGASPCLTETQTEAIVANPGVYRNEVRFRGMDEKTARKIRNIKRT